MEISIGTVPVPPDIEKTATALQRLGHRVRITGWVGDGAVCVELRAEAVQAEPVVCHSCHRVIAQSWLDECPACEGPLYAPAEQESAA